MENRPCTIIGSPLRQSVDGWVMTEWFGEFPSQRTSNAENVSIWWRHHGICRYNTNQDRCYSDIICMSDTASEIKGHSDVFQQLVQAYNKENIKARHHWPFVKGINRWRVDSLYKRSVMQKAYSCRDVVMGFVYKIANEDYHHYGEFRNKIPSIVVHSSYASLTETRCCGSSPPEKKCE